MLKKTDNSRQSLVIIREAVIFGVSMGLRIYILGVLLGGWLDGLLGSGRLCLLIGVLIAIVLSFYHLVRSFKRIEDSKSADRDPQQH